MTETSINPFHISTEKILDKKNAANKLLHIVVGGMRKYFILFSHIAKLFPSLP